MALTTSEARRNLFGLIEGVNLDHTEVEITSKRGSAVLMSKDEYDALVETSDRLTGGSMKCATLECVAWQPSSEQSIGPSFLSPATQCRL